MLGCTSKTNKIVTPTNFTIVLLILLLFRFINTQFSNGCKPRHLLGVLIPVILYHSIAYYPNCFCFDWCKADYIFDKVRLKEYDICFGNGALIKVFQPEPTCPPRFVLNI